MRGGLLVALVSTCAAVAGFLPPRSFADRIFDIDPAYSHATVEVGKSGPLSLVAGHTHQVEAPDVRGTIRLSAARSEVELTVPASSMTVSDAHEPAGDPPKIRETMLSGQVLDAAHHPTITFRSTSIVVRSRTATAVDAVVVGRLTIRDETRNVSLPVHADLDGGTLTAVGRVSIRQTDYGIKPVSVGGVVAVKDALEIAFHVVGRDRVR